MKTKQIFTGEKTLIVAIQVVKLCKYLKEEKKYWSESNFSVNPNKWIG